MLSFSSWQLFDLVFQKILKMLALKRLKLSKILFLWKGGGGTATVGNSSGDIVSGRLPLSICPNIPIILC